MAKEIAKKQSTEVDNYDADMFKGVETGFEGTNSETFRTPFMKILQAMSPELKKSDPNFVPGAQMGTFCNSATKEVHESLDIIVLKVDHSLLVWKPSRGGFVGRHSKAEEGQLVSSQEGVQKWDVEGNEVIDTIEFFCMNANDPSDLFILSLSKASIKHAKSFATRLRMLKMNNRPVGVSWAGVWNIQVVEESNEMGSWYTIGGSPKFERFVSKEEVETFILPAKEMLKSAVTDYSVVEEVAEEDVKEY